MTSDDRFRAITRLHALMAHTVANGCTEDEELSAARMAGRLAEEILTLSGAAPGDGPLGEASVSSKYELGADNGLRPSERVAAERLRAERESSEYKAALVRSTMEGLLKSAVQELAMAHLNTVSPPGKRGEHRRMQMVDARSILLNHLSMALGVASARMSRDVLADTIEELILDGMLPERLPIPLEP
jgi:hypothetical protein